MRKLNRKQRRLRAAKIEKARVAAVDILTGSTMMAWVMSGSMLDARSVIPKIVCITSFAIWVIITYANIRRVERRTDDLRRKRIDAARNAGRRNDSGYQKRRQTSEAC